MRAGEEAFQCAPPADHAHCGSVVLPTAAHEPNTPAAPIHTGATPSAKVCAGVRRR